MPLEVCPGTGSGRTFAELKAPIRAAIVETPAALQPNSALVAQKVSDFVRSRLRDFSPLISVMPAGRKGSAFSPADPAGAAMPWATVARHRVSHHRCGLYLEAQATRRGSGGINRRR